MFGIAVIDPKQNSHTDILGQAEILEVLKKGARYTDPTWCALGLCNYAIPTTVQECEDACNDYNKAILNGSGGSQEEDDATANDELCGGVDFDTNPNPSSMGGKGCLLKASCEGTPGLCTGSSCGYDREDSC